MHDEIETLLLKQRKAALLRKKIELTKGFGLINYRPHRKQDLFHRAGDRKRRGVFAGNRFGKSHLGCAEDCSWLYGERVWYPREDPIRTLGLPRRPTKGLVITTDWDKVEEIWSGETGDVPGKVWQFLPPDFIKQKIKNHAGVIATFVFQNNSVLRFDTVKSWMNNPQSSESSDWDFIHVDEPCPEAMFKAAARGLLDRDGSAWFTLTALTEPWITDLFVPRNVKLVDVQEFSRDQYWMIRGSMHDNPTLSETAKDLYISELSEEEKQCRVDGIPMSLAGLIYKEFDYATHVLQKVPKGWEAFNKPPPGWPIYLAIDPHPQTPHAVLFITVSPFGQIFFYDEIFIHCTIQALCEMINEKTAGRVVMYTLCDPLAYINDPITGSNMDEEFARHGVMVEKATKALAQGILRVKTELRRKDRLYFSPELPETLWEIQRYCWDTKNPDRKNKPVDKDDHMMENMYRLLLSDPAWVDLATGSNKATEDLVIDRPELEFEAVLY